MATPSKPLSQAISDYQAANPYSQKSFEGLFPYLTNLGYNVARTTHAGNTLASNDALVDAQGNVYDLVFDSDNPTGARWQNNPAGSYDPSCKIVMPNGEFRIWSDWSSQYNTGGT